MLSNAIALLFLAPFLSAPMCLGCGVLLFFAKSPRLRRFYVSFIAVALTIGLAWWSSICWPLRDGVGPDMPTSSGSLAWSRYLADMWPVLGFAIVIILTTGLAWRCSLRKSQHQQAPSPDTGKPRYEPMGLGLTLGVIFLATFSAYQNLLREAASGFMDTPPSLRQCKSPTNLGAAAFLRDEAFKDYSVYFYIFDTSPIPKPIYVGGPYASDGDVKMTNAIWSKDGSILAVRAKVGDTSGHNSSQYSGEFFVDSYDFRKRQVIASGVPTIQKSQQIKALIRQRGGPGQVALASPNAFTAKDQVAGMEDTQQFPR